MMSRLVCRIAKRKTENNMPYRDTENVCLVKHGEKNLLSVSSHQARKVSFSRVVVAWLFYFCCLRWLED